MNWYTLTDLSTILFPCEDLNSEKVNSEKVNQEA
jgi:hypothetical protein